MDVVVTVPKWSRELIFLIEVMAFSSSVAMAHWYPNSLITWVILIALAPIEVACGFLLGKL